MGAAAIISAVATLASAGVGAASAAGAFGGPEIEDLPEAIDPADERLEKARKEAERRAKRRRGLSSTILTSQGLGDVASGVSRPRLG